MGAALPWITRGLQWLGLFTLAYFTMPSAEKAKVQTDGSTLTLGAIIDVVKLLAMIFGIIAIIKLLQGKWRF